MSNSKYYQEDKIPFIRKKLETINEEDELLVSAIEKKNPVIGLILSLLIGSLGADRFYLGQVGLGILKLLTFGGFCLIDNYRLILNHGKSQRNQLQQISSSLIN